MGLFGGAIGKRWPFDVPCANDAEGIVDFLHVLLPSSACALQYVISFTRGLKAKIEKGSLESLGLISQLFLNIYIYIHRFGQIA